MRAGGTIATTPCIIYIDRHRRGNKHPFTPTQEDRTHTPMTQTTIQSIPYIPILISTPDPRHSSHTTPRRERHSPALSPRRTYQTRPDLDPEVASTSTSPKLRTIHHITRPVSTNAETCHTRIADRGTAPWRPGRWMGWAGGSMQAGRERERESGKQRNGEGGRVRVVA